MFRAFAGLSMVIVAAAISANVMASCQEGCADLGVATSTGSDCWIVLNQTRQCIAKVWSPRADANLHECEPAIGTVDTQYVDYCLADCAFLPSSAQPLGIPSGATNTHNKKICKQVE